MATDGTVWDNFASHSTAHGLSHITSKASRSRRIIWLIIFILCVLACIVLLSMNLTRYFEYRTTIETADDFVSKTDARVGFCLTIISSRSARAIASFDPYYKDIANSWHCWDWILPIIQNLSLLPSSPINDFLKFYYTHFSSTKVFELYFNKPSVLNNQFPLTIHDTLVSCDVNGKPCFAHDFEQFWDPRFGRCYQLKETHGLQTGGVELIVYLPIHDGQPDTVTHATYDRSKPVQGAGVVTMVSAFGTMPDVSTGISASPGLASYVSVEEHRYNRQTAPFRTNCTNQEKLEGWDYAYSQEMCYRTCLQLAVVKECGCASAYLTGLTTPPVFPEVGYCNNDFCDMNRTATTHWCAENAIKHAICDCRPSCHQVEFKTTLKRLAAWPMEDDAISIINFLDKNSTVYADLKFSYAYPNGTLDLKAIVRDEFFPKNLAYVKVYRSKVSATKIFTENPTMDNATLLSNIGGTFGLFIGLSIVTIIEVMEFTVDVLVHFWTPRCKPTLVKPQL